LARHFVRIFFALQEFIEKTRVQLHTTKVGRRCRAAQTSTRTSGAMFSRTYPHGSASIAALAGGEIGANRQVCLPGFGLMKEWRRSTSALPIWIVAGSR
jgi:hypothetical protein